MPARGRARAGRCNKQLQRPCWSPRPTFCGRTVARLHGSAHTGACTRRPTNPPTHPPANQPTSQPAHLGVLGRPVAPGLAARRNLLRSRQRAADQHARGGACGAGRRWWWRRGRGMAAPKASSAAAAGRRPAAATALWRLRVEVQLPRAGARLLRAAGAAAPATVAPVRLRQLGPDEALAGTGRGRSGPRASVRRCLRLSLLLLLLRGCPGGPRSHGLPHALTRVLVLLRRLRGRRPARGGLGGRPRRRRQHLAVPGRR